MVLWQLLVTKKMDVKVSDPLFPGVDEATIIDILTKRTNAQRQQIKAAYLQETGKVGRMRNSHVLFAHTYVPV